MRRSKIFHLASFPYFSNKFNAWLAKISHSCFMSRYSKSRLIAARPFCSSIKSIKFRSVFTASKNLNAALKSLVKFLQSASVSVFSLIS